MIDLKLPFWYPVNDGWKRFCFEYSFFSAKDNINLGYNRIARRISTWAESLEKLEILDMSIASYTSLSMKDKKESTLDYSITDFEGTSTSTKNLAKANEYV